MVKLRWTGTAKVLMDSDGWGRAVIFNEGHGRYILIGPLGCSGDGMEMKKRIANTEPKLRRLIEKELRDAGY